MCDEKTIFNSDTTFTQVLSLIATAKYVLKHKYFSISEKFQHDRTRKHKQGEKCIYNTHLSGKINLLT